MDELEKSFLQLTKLTANKELLIVLHACFDSART